MSEALKVIYVDCETTGLDPAKTELVQLAGIIEINGEVVEEFDLRCRPEKIKNIEAKALACNGLTVAGMRTFPTRLTCYTEFIATLDQYIDRYNKDDKFMWIGQNPNFDVGFVKALFNEFDNKYFGAYFDRRTSDLITLALAMRQRKLFSPINFKLTSMAAALNIEYDAHDALADIRTTREIWKIFLGWINLQQSKPAKQINLL